jgi:acyl carrier protein
MTHADIVAAVRAFLAESFLPPARAEALTERDDLFAVLDSLQVLRLVLQLEALYDIHVANSDLTPDNLGSLAKVAAFVEQRREPQ